MKPVTLAFALISALTLAACGVDGEPEQPDRATTGLVVSGNVSFGIVGSH